MKLGVAILFLCWPAWAASPMIKKFNHAEHIQKVFTPNKIECTSCHSLVKEPGSDSLKPGGGLATSTFQKPLKQVCHECHQSAEPKYASAPKACFTCHETQNSLSSIKPATHEAMSWKQNHATQARADGSACLNCHTNSQCVKCHTQRDNLFPSNHPRTYRHFHSIDARMAPQKCDSCHTKSYCMQCHVGKVK